MVMKLYSFAFSLGLYEFSFFVVLDCSPLTQNLAYGNIKLPDLNYLRHQIRQHDFLSLIE